MKDGLINLFKYPGMTSAKAVTQVKWLLPRRFKVGHAGTLDHFATGVLLILAGKATKLSEKLMSAPKEYVAKIKLGATTDTDDCDSPELPSVNTQEPTEAQIDSALRLQVGTILQMPPRFSALKVGGMRASDRIRMGEEVALRPRQVEIYAIERIAYEWPFVTIKVNCGRGTYVRSIARDLGEALGVGGYLVELCRTRIGDYFADDAVTIEQLAAADHDVGNIFDFILPLPQPDSQAVQSSQSQP